MEDGDGMLLSVDMALGYSLVSLWQSLYSSYGLTQ